MTEHKFCVFTFADMEVREREFCVVKDGEVLAVEPKAFRVLLFLLHHPHKLISKDELLDAVWNDCSVSENSLTRSVALLRRVLGDSVHEPRYIATVPTIGYRFLCDVEVSQDGVGGLGMGDSHRPPVIDINLPARAEEQQEQPSDGSRKRSTGLTLAGLFAVAFGILLAGLLVRYEVSKRAAPDSALAHLATEQRITSNPPEAPVTHAVVSPDGKYLAYSDPTGLYLRQINSGETRPWGLSKDFVAWPASWFPDSTHLLVTRLEGGGRMPGLDWKPSLWKLSLLGGGPQKLMDAAGGGVVSPDGTRIAYLPGPKYGSELWVMDSDGANARRIASATKPDQPTARGRWIYPVVWSPSGKRLAYIERHGVTAPAPVGDTFSLETRDANGGDLQVVLNDPRVAPAVWWAADGRILYAYREDPASERGDDGVYSIPVDERSGKATGQPQPVTDAEGSIGGLSATSDGKRIVLWRVSSEPQVFIAEFKAGSHQLKTPRRLTLDTNGNFASAWTSDSKAVLFVSNRNGTWKLFKQNIDETTAEVLVEGRSIFFPRLSADGSQVLYLVASRPDDFSFPASLMSKPLAGGPPRLVLQGKRIINLQCARTPAKLCIFSKLVGSDLIFASFDLEHGAGRELVRIPNGYLNWSLSPDGSRLAIFLDRHRIRFLSLDTGVAHDVSVNNWTLFNGDWSADGKSVFMHSVSPEGRPAFLTVNEAGKAEVAFEGQPNATFHWMVPSPDGRYAILEQEIPGDNNAWMVDNF